MPCPRLEASTWPAKEDLDTTGGRGSRAHNRLTVVIARCGGQHSDAFTRFYSFPGSASVGFSQKAVVSVFSQFRFLHELWVKQTINCKRNIVVREPHQLTTIYFIIRLLFGDVCYRAGPFLKFEKNRHMAARKSRFGCGFTLKLRFLVSVIKP